MTPAQRAALAAGDQMLLTLGLLRNGSMSQSLAYSAAKARDLLVLASRNTKDDGLYGDAVFEANIILGKSAFRRGDGRPLSGIYWPHPRLPAPRVCGSASSR